MSILPEICYKQKMIPARVKTILDDNGLSVLEFEEGSTPTAELAAGKIGVSIGQIAKSMLFKGKNGEYFLVVCAGDKKVKSSKLKKIVGIKTRMASPEETLEQTGYPPGGVCPFGLSGIRLFIDRSLEAYETVYPAAGTAASGVPMTFDQLVGVSAGEICDVTDED
jgi:prolyl-tRNA editing enzyme YbaK/EbsC (Cys-tRNA(Pro) deacylase)